MLAHERASASICVKLTSRYSQNQYQHMEPELSVEQNQLLISQSNCTDNPSPILSRQERLRMKAIRSFRLQDERTWLMPSYDLQKHEEVINIEHEEERPSMELSVIILSHSQEQGQMSPILKNSQLGQPASEVLTTKSQAVREPKKLSKKGENRPSKTKGDNPKNIPKNVVTAMLRETKNSNVYKYILGDICELKGTKMELVMKLMKQLSSTHLSLAKLKKHVSPQPGDSHFAVREAFGCYFQFFMKDSFEAYVWSSDFIFNKRQYIEYGLRCLGNLRENSKPQPQYSRDRRVIL